MSDKNNDELLEKYYEEFLVETLKTNKDVDKAEIEADILAHKKMGRSIPFISNSSIIKNTRFLAVFSGDSVKSAGSWSNYCWRKR